MASWVLGSDGSVLAQGGGGPIGGEEMPPMASDMEILDEIPDVFAGPSGTANMIWPPPSWY